MGIFEILDLIGGLCLFLFGMTLMGQALERRAGNSLKALLGKLTTNKVAGLLTGLGVTAIIQSSSATTVMVVGFVNSGLMTLKQAINVIMGANIGTTVTAWILSLAGIEGQNIFVNLLKPSSFTPILALVGIVLFMMAKNGKKKDTGMILLGFSTLMFGMQTMTDSVSGLRNVPEFQQLFLAFSNPILGVVAGAILTAIIQSSSASVGILQALASTGAVTYAAAIPIIMGQNIGTCVTALISSVGTGKNARRAALVHLLFNVIGTAVWLSVFSVVKATVSPLILTEPASYMGIAVAHTVFNVLCMLLILPMSGVLESLVRKIIPDSEVIEKPTELDERLLASPSLALEQCKVVLTRMANLAIVALRSSMACVLKFDQASIDQIRKQEGQTDRLEDVISTYLLKLSSGQLSDEESVKATAYMKVVGDYERIADHAVNIAESAEEMQEKRINFTSQAIAEYTRLTDAVSEILDLSLRAFTEMDISAARLTEPLEQVIDALKESLRTNHILRLQKGECSVIAGFVWSDLLTNLERTSDHCSNISGCVLDTLDHNMNIHENLRLIKNGNQDFIQAYQSYRHKYFPSA